MSGFVDHTRRWAARSRIPHLRWAVRGGIPRSRVGWPLVSSDGVRAPSLYVHVTGLAELRRLLAARGARELADALRSAVAARAGRDALSAAAGAYRRYAHEHPGCYAAMQRAPVGAGEDTDAAAELYGVIRAALSGYHLRGAAEVHGIRAVRAGLHGFASLEQVGGLRMRISTDASYNGLVEMLHLGLTALGAPVRAAGDGGA